MTTARTRDNYLAVLVLLRSMYGYSILPSIFFLQALLRVFFFFFFQAEDGIRDYKVTGVQTCALPISDRPRHLCGSDHDERRDEPGSRHHRSRGRLCRHRAGQPRRRVWLDADPDWRIDRKSVV